MTVCMFGNTSKEIRHWTMMACKGRADAAHRAIDCGIRLLRHLEEAGASRYERQQLAFSINDAVDSAVASIGRDLDEEGLAPESLPVDRSELDAAIAKLGE